MTASIQPATTTKAQTFLAQKPGEKPMVEIRRGNKEYTNRNHHPCRETGTIWRARHEVVLKFSDGTEQVLDGDITVRQRSIRFGRLNLTRIETFTGVGSAGVVGWDVEWLLSMNGIPREEVII